MTLTPPDQLGDSLRSLLAFGAVALAAGWTAWSFGLRAWVRRRAAAKANGKAGCGPDCGCGD